MRRRLCLEVTLRLPGMVLWLRRHSIDLHHMRAVKVSESAVALLTETGLCEHRTCTPEPCFVDPPVEDVEEPLPDDEEEELLLPVFPELLELLELPELPELPELLEPELLEPELPELPDPPFPPPPPPPFLFHRSFTSANSSVRSPSGSGMSWISVIGCGYAIAGVEVRSKKPRVRLSKFNLILNCYEFWQIDKEVVGVCMQK